jgi:hypothetical protein
MKNRSLRAIILNWPSYIQGRLFALIAVFKGSSATTCMKTVNCGRVYHAETGRFVKKSAIPYLRCVKKQFSTKLKLDV